MNFPLIDAVAMHRDHPDTFDAPSAEELAAVQPGWYVKLGFKLPAVPGLPGAERMWVEVTDIAPDRWKGNLNNDPAFCDLDCGDPVEFETKNVLAILPPAPKESEDA